MRNGKQITSGNREISPAFTSIYLNLRKAHDMKRVYRLLTSFIFSGVVLVFSAHSAHATQASTTSGQQTVSLQFSQLPPTVTNSGPPLLNYVRIDLSTDQTQGFDVFDATMDTTTVSPSVIFGYSDQSANFYDGTFAKVLKWDKGKTTEVQNLRLDGYVGLSAPISPNSLDLDGSIFGSYYDFPQGSTVSEGRFGAVNGVASWLAYPQFDIVLLGDYGTGFFDAQDASGTYEYLNETRINGQLYLFRQSENSPVPENPLTPVHDVFYPYGHYLNGVIGKRPLSGDDREPYYYSFWNGSQFIDFDQNLLISSWNNAGHIIGATRDDHRAFLYYNDKVLYISDLIPLQYRDKLSSLVVYGITNPNPDNQNSFFIYFGAELNQGTVAQPVIIRGRFRLQVPPIDSSSMIGKLVQRNDADVISRGFSGDSSYSFHDRYNVLSDNFYATSGYGDYGAILDVGGDQFDTAGNPIPNDEQRAHAFLSVPAELAVDANRDGTITLASENTGPASSDTTTKDQPFRFWVNDDDDAGDTLGTDIPQTSTGNLGPANWQGQGSYFGVNGARDLIDWFPVYLNIKQLLAILPPGNDFQYKLKQADSALNFVYTSLTRSNALNYQRQDMGATFGPDFSQKVTQADKQWITSAGVTLSSAFLNQTLTNSGGVILVEGRAPTTKPLVLSVEKSDGTVVAEVKLELSISPVEDMFRHLNLRDGAGAAAGIMGDQRDSGPATRLGAPAGLPDKDANQPWFIFVVGSNVSGQSARGWESETFKRLYWSRGTDGKFAKTRFLGVSWFGDPYSNSSEGVYDYHLAVRNAFATAPALASAVNNLTGTGSKTIGGHSLACGLISAALSDHGMNVAHATLIDAAIAREVFDGRAGSGNQLNVEESGMTPAVWRNYDPRLQSPSWHERFAAVSGDNRQSLTWRNRFIGAVPTIHSFYSPTEDALASYDGEVPSTSLGAAAVVLMNGATFTAYVWVYQEKAKGNRQDYYLPFLGSFHAGSTYAGWGMNIKDPVLSGDPTYWKWVNSPDYIGRMIKTSAEIGSVSDSILRRHSVFEPGWGVVRNQEQQEIPVSNVSPVSNAPSWIYDLYGATSGSTLVGGTTSANRAQLLAEAIPAQSWAVGSHQLNTSTLPIGKQHNMPAEYTGTGWPRPTINGVREWRHSDMREVAYLYQSRFWDALVSISQQP